MVCTMFSVYCEDKFVVEQVEIEGTSGEYDYDRFFNLPGTSATPDWSVEREVSVEIDYLTRGIGLPVEKENVVKYLHRMQLPSCLSADEKSVIVSIPPLRSDILHACDILEDVAIGYGFDRILAAAETPRTVCRGAQQPIEKLRFVLSTHSFLILEALLSAESLRWLAGLKSLPFPCAHAKITTISC